MRDFPRLIPQVFHQSQPKMKPTSILAFAAAALLAGCNKSSTPGQLRVEVTVEEEAPELREVGDPVSGDAVRVGHLHRHRIEQHDAENVHVGGLADVRRPRPAAAAGETDRERTQYDEPGENGDPRRGTGRQRRDKGSHPDHEDER